jgi:rhodanese-related sulfurtransferase
MKKILVVVVIALAAFLWYRSEFGRSAEWRALLKTVRNKYPDVRQVSTEFLAERLADPQAKPILLDTRTAGEFAVSHIGNAIHVSPDATEFPMLDSLSRDAEIIAYCSVGYRSSEIAKRLSDAGFTNVSNLEGSIFKWANEGRPVRTDSAETNSVHPYNAVWGRFLRGGHDAGAGVN